MDLKKGIIKIGNEKFFSEYSFSDFKASEFYNAQSSKEFIYIHNTYELIGHKFRFSLWFKDDRLHIISLLCVDIEIPFEQESERKALHDEILLENGLLTVNTFDWGTINSNFDSKGCVANILIAYK